MVLEGKFKVLAQEEPMLTGSPTASQELLKD
jgi:hypothetical protein